MERNRRPTRDDEYRAQFEEEALPHLSTVYNFALNLTRDSSVADDLAQDTFLHAFRGFHNFRIGTSCRAWLMKICRNLFIDRLRRHGRRPSHVSVETVEPETRDRSFDRKALDDFAAKGEENVADLFGDEINEHLAELPDEFREALLLCDIEGLSYKEITEIMGTPVGTVRSRISRARRFLRERLEAYARNLGFLRWQPDDCPAPC